MSPSLRCISYLLIIRCTPIIPAALAIDGDTFQVLARDGTSKVTKKYIDVKGSMSEKYFLPDGTVYALRDLDQPASQQNI